MRDYKLVTAIFLAVLTPYTFGLLSPNAIAQEPPKPPTFGCEAGAGHECSYVIGDELPRGEPSLSGGSFSQSDNVSSRERIAMHMTKRGES
jgi:hypothetical protein